MDNVSGVAQMTKEQCVSFLKAYNFRDVSLKRRGTPVPHELQPVTTREGLVRLYRVAMDRGMNFDQSREYVCFRWAGDDPLVLASYLQHMDATGDLEQGEPVLPPLANQDDRLPPTILPPYFYYPNNVIHYQQEYGTQ